MYLKSLEINGFKSFAKKAVFEFNTPITAIVGPNGSGKSNVAEAFRFVLGEQSIKSMRGKRGEDLIFNGGKSASRQNRASVKLVFDNTTKALGIDFDEVSIERVVHRDSANEYFINGSAVRLKDIIEMLANVHIGASGHHIISQGEADKILNANLHERREMIEDALGLKIYQYKREESERKLEKTEENIKQVESLRKEIAPHIRFLEKQVEKVEKSREMRVKLEDLYKDYFKREQFYITHEKNQIAHERTAPEQHYAQLSQQLQEAKEILSRSATKDVKSEELLSLEQSLQNARNDKDTLMRDIGRIEGQLASEERILKRQKELLASQEAKQIALKDVEGVAHDVYAKVEEAEREEDSQTLKSILRGIREMLQNFIAHNHAQDTADQTSDSVQEIARLNTERDELTAKLQVVVKNERECTEQYNALKLVIEREKDSNRDAEKAVFKIMAEQNELMSKLNEIKLRSERITSIEDEFKLELQEAAALVGRAILDFEQVEISAEQAQAESRHEQEERRKAIERIKIRLEDSGAGNGEDVLKEYNEAKDRDAFLTREIEDLLRSAETLKTLIKDLSEKLDTEFKTGVEKINTQFQEFFRLMFNGGTANLQVIREVKRRRKSETELLETEDEEDFIEEEGEEGIDINITLPQKRIKGLMMLSGGERALTSIALLFAISQVNPPPFIILDETDAALDEANSRKYGDMIDNLSKYSQLILITHNRETMSRAGVLYGVTMSSEGASNVLSIKFDDAVAVAK